MNLKRLEELAKAATPRLRSNAKAQNDFIDEANPANIQELLALVHEMANDLQCVSGAFHSDALTKYKEAMK